MKIETTRFGAQEIEQDTILHFPNGLHSGNKERNTHSKDFKLFHKKESELGPIVFWLQSIDDPDSAYTIIDPALVGFYYDVSLPDEDYDLLDSQSPEDIAIMVIITGTEDGENKFQKEGLNLINGNVTEPLFINLRSQKGLQRSVKDLDYDIFLNIPVLKTGKANTDT